MRRLFNPIHLSSLKPNPFLFSASLYARHLNLPSFISPNATSTSSYNAFNDPHVQWSLRRKFLIFTFATLLAIVMAEYDQYKKKEEGNPKFPTSIIKKLRQVKELQTEAEETTDELRKTDSAKRAEQILIEIFTNYKLNSLFNNSDLPTSQSISDNQLDPSLQAHLYMKLAQIESLLKHFSNSEKCYLSAMSIYSIKYGKQCPQLIHVCKQLSSLHQRIGKMESAEHLLCDIRNYQ